MATPQLIDRRLNGRHKSAQNRQRFIRRYKEQIKQAIAESIAGRSITDVASGGEVRIPRRDIAEPEFQFGNGGWRHGVHPGNREFVAGDTIKRPEGGGEGQGNEAGDGGEGEDDFTFTLTRDEFMDLFFEDLALPNLQKTRIQSLVEEESVRSGHTHDGVPSNIDIVCSLTGARARRTPLPGPLPAELAETGSHYWRAVELSLNSSWFVATLCSTGEDQGYRRTMLVSWDTDLVQILENMIGGYLEALLFMSPPWHSADGQWRTHPIKQIWRAYDAERDNEPALIFTTSEGQQI